MAVGRDCSDHISRVNVFKSDVDAPLCRIVDNLFFEETSNILNDQIFTESFLFPD